MRMRMPRSSVLSFLAVSAFVLAASVTADNYDKGGQQQQNKEACDDQYDRAYHKPAAGLVSEYYGKSCPDMERIVQAAVNRAIANDYTVAAGLIRLFFHDFAVRGCDGSILIDAPGSERHAAASKTLRGFELIEEIKAKLNARCNNTVSCADILTAATRDASMKVGVPYWSLKYGRKDGRDSHAEEADAQVPMGRERVTDLVQFFETRGLNVLDLVILSGAHTIGKASCGAVKRRVLTSKPETLDRKYGDFLLRKCHRGDDAERVELDGESPTTFDNRYYQNLERRMGLLETDQGMLEDSRTTRFVKEMAREPEVFKRQFAHSMRQLGEVNVLTGDEGEVRYKCSAVNY
ncbi:peroxidase 7 [Brachypodium distachyon]|uniref:Peroxidase n=1 Tax=Brachypodium distachyon TaxID=15368 RepID=I1GU69_BRADI|nr:peroxidase 7 [Brachypodium distachyon]KQK16117.1 hypothetical protein BRADI_1g26870v3 [Brachypodium distachyon]|eukprot:XP_024317241.1 peroxidase 7 [Brachypodium distachyon]